jgi:LPXTG-motif cell wall-anchored protein
VKTAKDKTTRNIVIVGALAVATVLGFYIYKKYKK